MDEGGEEGLSLILSAADNRLRKEIFVIDVSRFSVLLLLSSELEFRGGRGVDELEAEEVARRGDDKGFENISIDDEPTEDEDASTDESRDEVVEEDLETMGFSIDVLSTLCPSVGRSEGRFDIMFIENIDESRDVKPLGGIEVSFPDPLKEFKSMESSFMPKTSSKFNIADGLLALPFFTASDGLPASTDADSDGSTDVAIPVPPPIESLSPAVLFESQ